jgi:hypothetical protein
MQTAPIPSPFLKEGEQSQSQNTKGTYPQPFPEGKGAKSNAKGGRHLPQQLPLGRGVNIRYVWCVVGAWSPRSVVEENRIKIMM